MKSRNKKTNRLSDFAALVPAVRPTDLARLQQSRLLKPAFLLQRKFKSKKSESKQKVSKAVNLVKPVKKTKRTVFSAKEKKTEFFPFFHKKSSHQEINLLPQNPGRFTKIKEFYTSPAMASVAIFVSVALLGLSVFPLLNNIGRDLTTSARVLGAATEAYASLNSAQQELLNSNLDGADFHLSQAYQRLNEASAQFQELSSVASLAPQAPEAEKLLTGAKEAVLALQYLAAGMDKIVSLRLSPQGITSPDEGGLPEALTGSEEDFRTASSYLQSANQIFASVDEEVLPDEYKDRIEQSRDLLKQLSSALGVFSSLRDIFSGFTSGEEKNYLMLFQNYRELRATGGFIGTVGLLTLDHGEFKNIKIETVYNPDGQLVEHYAPPAPLQLLLTDKWGLRDSNWFFDFPTSARKASMFYSKETGVGVDGVMAFTPEIFIKLLELTGPIAMPEYNEVLDAQNFLDVVQYQTSVVYDKKLNQPKKFLADFAPRILERMQQLSTSEWLTVIQLFLDGLQKKDLLVYVSDGDLQSSLSQKGWTGEVKNPDADYLAIVNSNVGAGKTDQNISQDIDLNIALQPDGRQLHTLNIVREHIPGNEKDFPVNVDYMRVYAPQGARLISATGFDREVYSASDLPGATLDSDVEAIDNSALIDVDSGTVVLEESGKTVFANWVKLAPGETREMQLVYEVSMAYNLYDSGLEPYAIYLQKQPGAPSTKLKVSITAPSGKELIWVHPSGKLQGRSAVFQSDFRTDLGWGIIFK